MVLEVLNYCFETISGNIIDQEADPRCQYVAIGILIRKGSSIIIEIRVTGRNRSLDGSTVATTSSSIQLIGALASTIFVTYYTHLMKNS
jgi:hypothetical protein